jgi:predicted permease
VFIPCSFLLEVVPVHDLWQDLRHTLRAFAARPIFTLLAVVTLAIGIGASTAIFSLVNAVVFKGVPGLQPPSGLVEVSRDMEGQFFDLAYPVIQHWRESSDSTTDLAAFSVTPLSLAGDPEPSVHTGYEVTGNYFSMLNLRPTIGRFFDPVRSFYPRVDSEAVVSHWLWTTRFDADPEVVGRVIRINGHPATVIGVGPPDFRGHQTPMLVDLFVPVGMPAPGLETAASLDSPWADVLEVFGRLAPGRSASEAAEELGLLADRLLREIDPDYSDQSFRARVLSWEPVPAAARSAIKAFLIVLMGIVGLALAITCTNVASLVLSRVTERRGELTTRLALGATRGRIARQLLTESLVLFLAGGAVGLALAAGLLRALLIFEPPLPPGFAVELDLSLDWRVYLFGLLLSVVSAVVFGLLPGLKVASHDWLAGLKEQSAATTGTRMRLRQALVGLQVGVTVLLLVVAGLFARALGSMRSLDPGWDAAGVWVMPIDLELAGYTDERGELFYEQLMERVRGLPIQHATLASKLPLAGRSTLGDVNVEGVVPPDGQRGFRVFFNRVAPGYFDTMQVSLLQGRDVDASDVAESPRVAVINRAMAQRFWPDGSAIGRRFHTGTVAEGTPFEVVGVVENAKYNGLVEETPHFVYLPYRQRYNHQMTLHVRVDRDAGTVVLGMREAVRTLDPGLPVQSVMPLDEALQAFFLPQRLASWVGGVLGLVGLLLAAIGVYGAAAFAAAQRRREIGVRMALGARPGDVIRLLLRQGLTGPLAGAIAGLLIAAVVTRPLRDLLAGVSAIDTITFAGVLLGIVVVSGVAVLVPASRAARTEPAVTLRRE